MEVKLHPDFYNIGIDWSKYFSSIYYKNEFLKAVSIDLLYMSKQFFQTARIVNDFEYYKSIPAGDIIGRIEFIDESIIDAIKIVLCFENYMKAKLLMNEQSVHIIIKDKSEKLFYKQKEEPVSKNELLILQPYVFENGVPVLNTIHRSTLQVSTLLKDEYQKILGLPKEVKTTLQSFIKLRNEIHFYTLASFIDNITDEISLLKKYVESDLEDFFKKLF